MTERALLDQSLEDLRLLVERHRRLLRTALEGQAPDGSECFWSDCPHRRALMELTLHAVEVLDDTRKAFKSKRLEELRKDFLKVLTEEVRSQRSATKPLLG
ncbi:MAG TPA: hypothetical protein VHA11_02290 [Bryobacteraceae bacterium]|nr:hypothetical protein [Bryobacteraceae bacterium]